LSIEVTYWTSQTLAPVKPAEAHEAFARLRLRWPVATQLASTGAWYPPVMMFH
jgi:hypothetical protein